jgi:hypothetical protein
MVVAEESAETLSALDGGGRIGDLFDRRDAPVAEPLVRPLFVIVGHVLAYRAAELVFVHGDQVVQALGLDGEDEPLGR